MTVPFWAQELAASFWSQAGMIEPFPRNLRRPIARAFPLAVVHLPCLRIEAVRGWLRHLGISLPCADRDRPLRACLLARSGCGFVFIDGSDPEDEQRLSLAHELAHFLRHYWQPRRSAASRLGDGVLEVFDGVRRPRRDELLRSVLAGVALGFHAHLMERDEGGAPASGLIALAETEADRLAYELLAPAEYVIPDGGEPSHTQPALAARLNRDYGMPIRHAREYARLLAPAEGDPLLVTLGLGG